MYHCTLMQTNPGQFQVILRDPTHAMCEGPYVCANTKKQEKKGVGCVQAKGEKMVQCLEGKKRLGDGQKAYSSNLQPSW